MTPRRRRSKSAEHLTDAEKAAETAKVTAAQGTVTVAKNANDDETARQTAEAEQKAKEEAEAKAEEMAAAGKALKKALGSNPLGHLEDIEAGVRATLAPTGLTVDPEEGAGVAANSIAAVELKAGDSAGSLGSWSGTDYSKTNAGTKTTDTAIVYSNPGPAKSRAFAKAHLPNTDSEIPYYTFGTAAAGILAVGKKISADDFPTAGEKIFEADVNGLVSFSGTYDGASGTYSCNPAGGTDCAATYSSATGISLAGPAGATGWRFTPASGAMTSEKDSNYLFFGWWLRTVDGEPEMASAFYGKLGTISDTNGDDTEDTLALSAISGSATYSGHAAGKFAISHPINGGDAGHFTADATLTAKFGTSEGAGVTGVIDNFMANGEAVPWSVALNNNTLVSAAAADTPLAADAAEPADVRAGSNLSATGAINPAFNYAWTAGNEARTTVWSIDRTAAAASGTWSAQMYDEKPGPSGPNLPGDGSNIPTSVIGTFQSQFGSDHSMVGAFGATTE